MYMTRISLIIVNFVLLEYNFVMKERSIIGKRIEEAREFRQMERKNLAEAVGCSYREILRWETTRQEPKAMTLKKIADVLGIKMDYFVEEESVNPRIITYLKDEAEIAELTGLDEALKAKKDTAKSYVSQVNGRFTLQTMCHLMMNYIDAHLLNSIAVSVQGLVDETSSELNALSTNDDLRLYINKMVDQISDPDLLKKIANIEIESTGLSSINQQVAIAMQFAEHPMQEPAE